MAHVMQLENGLASFEFEESDFLSIEQAIQRLWGTPDTVPHAVHADMKFGGEFFTFYFEWDEQCLISQTIKGSAMLTELQNYLGLNRK
jgi:hypothetical protein